MRVSFSSANRQTWMAELKNHTVDLLVVGGGLSGAGIALDASLRGLETILLERKDFAEGASGRSSKLFHGGMSYFHDFDMKKYQGLTRERSILRENAPHVTKKRKLLIPLYKESLVDRLKASVHLKLFDHVGEVKKTERVELLSKKQTMKLEPMLHHERLKGSGSYIEYQINDARLTIEVLKEAINRGAKALNYMQVESFLYEEGKACGVIAVDQLSGEAIKINAKKIVNATGAWTNQLREQDRTPIENGINFQKGSHLVIKRNKLPLQTGVFYRKKEGNKAVFAIPQEDYVYIGMAESDWNGQHDAVFCTDDELHLMLHELQQLFPGIALGEEDIVSSWSGIAPYFTESKKSKKVDTYRDIHISESGVISVLLDALAGYRLLAEQVVDLLCQDLGVNARSVTESITLTGGYVGGADMYLSFKKQKVEEGKQLGLSEKQASVLVDLYGSNIGNIYAKIKTKSRYAQKWGLPPELYAQLRYSIEEEMVISPSDFMVRRTGALYFDHESVRQYYEQIFMYFAENCHWTTEQLEQYLGEFRQLLEISLASEKINHV